MGKIYRAWAAASALAVIATVALTGCDAEGDEVTRVKSAKRHAPPPPPPVVLAVTPADNAKNLPLSTEIGTSVKNGTLTSVSLAETGGPAVRGEMREDGTSWVPDKPLKASRSYTAKVTATSAAGKVETKTITFGTMKSPNSRTGTGLYLFDDRRYGVAMPVVVEFDPPVSKKNRAGVQRRMFVSTDPAQPGTWSWSSNGRQAQYRAPEYWRPGTKISVRIALGGHPTGKGRYGDRDRAAVAKIGDRFEMKVSNRTKTMSVYRDGRLVRTMPVSLGKTSTPSSSGTMIIMEKKRETVFDTFDELGPEEGYRTDIEYAQRLTWGGEFIHGAPWSVGAQGVRNVSHGCVNVSTGNARWLFDHTKVGDPVTVTGTGRSLAPGNGWTAWNMTWVEFVEGSALPVPVDLQPSPPASLVASAAV